MSERTVVLRFEDLVEREIKVADGETILDAALRQELPLVHQCRSGSCSSCTCKVVEGDVEMSKGSAMSLIPSEIAEGVRLLCLAHPVVDSVVALDYPITHLYDGAPQLFTAKVVETEWVGQNVVRLLVTAPRGLDLGCKPGQFFRIRVPGTDEWRAYSPSSPARQLPKLEFLIRVLDKGMMSDALRGGFKKGQELEMEGPFGAFYLRDDGAAHRLFIAGGTGLAPVMAMIDAIRYSPSPKGPMTVSFGCNSEETFFYKDELELREAWMPSLKIRLSANVVNDPASGLLTGTPVSVLSAADVTPETVAYLCGPPPMIEAARAQLAQLGVAAGNIYYEQFTAST